MLSQLFSRKTLAVDLHPDFGDAALYLGLTKYRYHSYELIENTDRLDAELLQSFVLRHSSGLDLIPAPQGTEPARSFASGALVQTFEFLRLGYEFILVDLPQGLNDEYLELIRGCDQINIVTVAEVSASAQCGSPDRLFRAQWNSGRPDTSHSQPAPGPGRHHGRDRSKK